MHQRDKRTGQCGVEEVDRNRVVEHAARPRRRHGPPVRGAVLIKPSGHSSVLSAETFRRDGDADANWEAPLGPCDQRARIAWHYVSHRWPMALAGLWENWRSSAGEWVRSFAIVTTTPNELCAEIHNRMPVVLKPRVWPVWLGEEPADLPQLKALLAPYPSEEMTCWPVTARVGNVKNNDPSLIEPIAVDEPA
jgi:hypothetical protein